MRIAINGLGRIGRQLLRRALATPGLDLVALNDLAPAESLAHLVKYDSVHGRAPFPVGHDGAALVLDGRRIPLSAAATPEATPFRDLGVDLVVECTGRFTARGQAAGHLGGSVRRVLVSAPVADADATLLPGLPVPAGLGEVVSAGCPASHALALLLPALDQGFGVTAALAVAVESYGNDQRILDLPHADARLARAAAASMIPAPSQAAECLAAALPWTRGRLDTQAVRVPTPDVGILDLSVVLERDADPGAVHAALRQNGREGLLEFLDEPLVSVDLRGREASALVDTLLTRALSPRFFKVYAWYDNETAYAARLCDFCREVER